MAKTSTTKVWTAEEIRSNLNTSDKWLFRGILAIHAYQTLDEKSSKETKYHNGVGFNGRDAAFLSSLADQIRTWQIQQEQGTARFPKPLSVNQIRVARRKMLKYAGQLARIANNSVDEEGDEANQETPEEREIRIENELEARMEREAIQAEQDYVFSY